MATAYRYRGEKAQQELFMTRTSTNPECVESNAILVVQDLGKMSYQQAFDLQVEAHKNVVETRGLEHSPMTLFLVEHDPPVITVSRRPSAKQHLVASLDELNSAGIEVEETNRGGDITYHGPGQLVVYPILDLNRLGLRLNSYLRLLEQVMIDVLSQFDLVGERDSSATGVWMNGSKICAIGVRVSRWVTMHGLALNVTTNLNHFKYIVPCGLIGRSVTSMQHELGDRCPTMSDVKKLITTQFHEAIQSLLQK